MISPLMVSSKNVKVSQKRCLGTSIESFTGSSPSEQIVGFTWVSERASGHILGKPIIGGRQAMIYYCQF